jgi:hypothetical protein
VFKSLAGDKGGGEYLRFRERGLISRIEGESVHMADEVRGRVGELRVI